MIEAMLSSSSSAGMAIRSLSGFTARVSDATEIVGAW
jgi:hypothetical protein